MSEVYFVQPTNGGPIRVGASQQSANRIISIGTWHPQGVELIATLPGYFMREATLHALLRPFVLQRDWFRSCSEVWRLLHDASDTGLPWLPPEPTETEIRQLRADLKSRVRAAFGSSKGLFLASGLRSKQAITDFYEHGFRPTSKLYGLLVARELKLQGALPNYMARWPDTDGAEWPTDVPRPAPAEVAA